MGVYSFACVGGHPTLALVTIFFLYLGLVFRNDNRIKFCVWHSHQFLLGHNCVIEVRDVSMQTLN